MADAKSKPDAHDNADEATPRRSLRALASQAVQVAIVHWKRTLAAAATLSLLVAGIAFSWTYTADLAIDAERAKVAAAFAALDAGQYDKARSIVRDVLTAGILPRDEQGGPLFVLGVVKNRDAREESLPERSRTDFLVASRYLRESQANNFYPGREKQGLLILGSSLVGSLQAKQGIAILQSALELEPTQGGPLNAAIRRALAEAYAMRHRPNLDRALKHIEGVLADEQLADDERADALLLKARILSQQERFDEASKTFASLPPKLLNTASVMLARAKALLDGVEKRAAEMPPSADGRLPAELERNVDEAVSLLGEAQSLDATDSQASRRALYLLGRVAELHGDTRQALQLYGETHQQYGDSTEGMAARLAEADIRRNQGNDEAAQLLYRHVLQSDLDPESYRSDLIPLPNLRQRILAAVEDFVQRDRYGLAVSLLDRFLPLFTRTQELALRGQTLREWGAQQLRESPGDSKRDVANRREGLKRFREAAMAFERLASLRFATAMYPDDLWESAECFFRGQSYSNAARVLDIYLKHEPERRNAQALLLLGQAELALGQLDSCIAAFEECIELYPLDNAIYQARIDCARAYLYQGKPEDAERLLRYNLNQSTLKPLSPEWKDSLFALGRLLFDLNRHEEAISTLEEAVERYPSDRQSLQARYLIGESYRRWAAEPLERLAIARTTSEREKSQLLVDQRMRRALEYFKDVQSRITLQVHNLQDDPIYGSMRRNCYMLEGACLFDLGRYQQAIEAYQNVSALYPNEPFVLETFLQIAHCWQRMNRPENARGAVEQARLTLEEMPSDADFLATTAFTRDEWRLLLNDMSKW